MLSRRVLAALPLVLAAPSVRAQTLTRVSFGTNWVAQAEHGGFYQAVADGTYRELGLDVTIAPGGPQANNRMLFSAGRLDFYMGGMIQAFSAVERQIPTTVIAAMFQKEPQVMLAHPDQGLTWLQDLVQLPTIFVSRDGVASFWQWMKAEFGFRDEQVKPYTFNPQPFLADKRSAMQGYLSSEPFAIRRTAGFDPQVFLLADAGFEAYSTTIEARTDLISQRTDVARRFVEGSILGWYRYLYGDNSAANAAILRDNPEMTADRIAYAVEKLKAHGIVDSGDATTLGIGAVTEERVKRFFEQMSRVGVVNAGIDWRKAFDNRFVNKGLGRDLRR